MMIIIVVSAFQQSVSLISPHSRLSYFVERSSFFATQGRFFLTVELSRGTTIAAVIGQAGVDLKLEFKGELLLTL